MFFYVVRQVSAPTFKFGVSRGTSPARLESYRTAFVHYDTHTVICSNALEIERDVAASLLARRCLVRHDTGRMSEVAYCGEGDCHLLHVIGMAYSLRKVDADAYAEDAHESDAPGDLPGDLQGGGAGDEMVWEAPARPSSPIADMALQLASPSSAALACGLERLIDARRTLVYSWKSRGWYRLTRGGGWEAIDVVVLHAEIVNRYVPELRRCGFTNAVWCLSSHSGKKDVVRELSLLCMRADVPGAVAGGGAGFGAGAGSRGGRSGGGASDALDEFLNERYSRTGVYKDSVALSDMWREFSATRGAETLRVRQSQHLGRMLRRRGLALHKSHGVILVRGVVEK